jgi:hypothetical protein
MKALVKITFTLICASLLALPVYASNPDPPSVDIALQPGEAYSLEKKVTTPSIPPMIDIVLVEDETGSFYDDIGNLQALAPDLVSALDASGSDYATAVVGFRDFDQSFWGSPGDHVYRLLSDLAPGGSSLLSGVGLLTAIGGADGPEAQLEALHYLATPGHPSIDSNGDGDTTDFNDTPTGQQPAWRAGSQRVVLLATDAPCHVTSDAGGWPGDSGTTDPATTAGILDAAGITVIGLTPGGSGYGCVDVLAAGTGGSIQATTSSGSDIVGAILAGLEELKTDVWWEADCDPGLNVWLDPDVRYDIPGDTQVTFEEIIEVTATPDTSQTLHCTVTFIANEYPDEGSPIGEQEIAVKVVIIDIKPGSFPNSINPKSNGVVPVAILGGETFDVIQVDVTTLAFGPAGATPAHDLTDPSVYTDHLQDVNEDGYVDLVSHHRQKETGLSSSDAVACLTGIAGDVPFTACDSARVLK